MSGRGSSTGGLSLKLSAGNTAIVDIDRWGASEMVPQPGAVDKSAAVIIHALIRNSKQDTWAGEIVDLVNECCMAHRKGYFRNDHAPKYRRDTGGEEAQKPAIGPIN